MQGMRNDAALCIGHFVVSRHCCRHWSGCLTDWTIQCRIFSGATTPLSTRSGTAFHSAREMGDGVRPKKPGGKGGNKEIDSFLEELKAKQKQHQDQKASALGSHITRGDG